MKISVIIPTQGENQRVHRILDSLVQQKSCKPFETLLVCNPSRPELKNLENQYQSIGLRVLQSDQVGANHARQLGLDSAKNELVCFFDDDCVLNDPMLLTGVGQTHQKDPDLFAAGGRYEFESARPTPVQKIYFQMQNRWIQEGILNLETSECAYLFGGFLSFKKSLALKNELRFDISMKFGGTEKEFCLQAGLKGLRLRLLPLSVGHTYSEGFWSYLKKVFKQGRGQRYIERKSLLFEPRYRLSDPQAVSLQAYLLESSYWLGYYAFDHQYLLFLKNRFIHTLQAISLNKVLLLNRIKKDL